jgi:hypothetical protein
VLGAETFDSGKFILELTQEDDQLWLDAWDEILAGA